MANKERTSSYKTSIGGQALIEGIMMRGPKTQAIVCRTAEGLVEKTEELKFVKDKYPILGLPLIRGCATFLSSLIKGMQALTYSAELVPLEEQGEPDKLDAWIEAHFPAEQAQKLIIGVAVVLGIALSLFLFIFLPAFIVGLIEPLKINHVVRNLSEGVVRVIILLIYMRLCCLSPDVKRLFAYHGAEHKTIFCYEHGKPLTVANVRGESRFHPRCGTSFIFIMLILSVIVFSFVTWENIWLRLVLKPLLLPLICGLGFEFILYAGKHENLFTKIVAAPGLWMQRITTREPDLDQLEIAITAMKSAMPDEFPQSEVDEIIEKSKPAPAEGETDAENEASPDAAESGSTEDGADTEK